MNLSEMPAEKLLAEYEQTFEDGALAGFDKLNKAYELRAELLRRLQPVKPHCPMCGSGSGRLDVLRAAIVKCSECRDETYVPEMADFAQFFTSNPSVLSREGEGKDEKS